MKNIMREAGAFTDVNRNIANHNFSDVGYCSTTFSAVTGTTGTTLTNVTGLKSDILDAGATYKFRIHLSTVATSNSGLKIGLAQLNGLTLTSMESFATGKAATTFVTNHSTSVTNQASLIASTTAILECIIEGSFVVATAGSLQLQAAQNAAHADTTSVYLGSTMQIERILPTG